MYSPDLPLPDAFDTSVSAYIETPAEPLALQALSADEKRLLTMSSINSDASRRPVVPRETNSHPRHGGKATPAKKEYDRKDSREDQQHPDDLWDNPGELGSFSGGIFDTQKTSEGDALAKEINSGKWSIVESPASAIAEKHSPKERNAQNKLVDVKHSGFQDDVNHQVFQDDFKHSVKLQSAALPAKDVGFDGFQPSIHHQQHQQVRLDGFEPVLRSQSPIVNPHRSPAMHQRTMTPVETQRHDPVASIPPFRFVPPQWVYKDPAGVTQGPFTSQQMQTWFKEGYFPNELPIKCVDDPAYIILAQFVEKYGRDAPFLEAMLEQEQLERVFYLRQVQQVQQIQQQRNAMQMPLGISFGQVQQHGVESLVTGGLNQLLGSTRPVQQHSQVQRQANNRTPDFQDLLMNPAIANVVETLDPQQRLSYLNSVRQQLESHEPLLQQTSPNAVSSRVISPPKGGFARKSPALNNDAAFDASATNVHPITSPESSIVDAVTPEGHSRSPKSLNTIISKHSDATVTPNTSSREVKKTEQPKEAKPANADQKGQKKPKQQEKSSPSVANEAPAVQAASQPAPWASAQSRTGPSAATGVSKQLSLQEIQEQEQKEHEEQDRVRQKEAEQQLLAEAQMLAQRKQQGATSAIPSQAAWASTGSPWNKTAALKNVLSAGTASPKKSLSEIMQDEAERKNSESSGSTTVGKRYADTIGPSNVAAKSWSGRISAVVATGPVLKPVLSPTYQTAEATPGWKTAAQQRPPTGQSAAHSKPPAVIVAPKTASSANAKADPLANMGVSHKFVTWCRSSLLGVQKTSSLNVDEFIGILLSIPVKEHTTITMICDDTLGGNTAIDPRKFADEFLRRRRADASGSPWVLTSQELDEPQKGLKVTTSQENEADVNGDDEGWNTVQSGRGSASSNPSSVPGITSFSNENKFVVVQSGKKKKKKK